MFRETQCHNDGCPWYTTLFNAGFCTSEEGNLTELCPVTHQKVSSRSEINWLSQRPHFIPSIITSIMLLLSIAPMPYLYYDVLKWAVMVSALFVEGIGITLFRQKKRVWWVVIVFGLIAILFNPINAPDFAQLGLLANRVWIFLDLVCTGIFLYTAFNIRRSQEETWDFLLYLGLFIVAGFYTAIAFIVLLLIRDFLTIFR